jgi:translation initiation factor 1
MSDAKLVFSTDTRKQPDKSDKPSKWVKSSGPAKMRLETGGRGGKSVTVLFNLPWDEVEAVKHLKSMQAGFGCGGSIKDATVELRGDVRQKVEAYLLKNGIKIVRAGG